jgi:hypothetical protein
MWCTECSQCSGSAAPVVANEHQGLLPQGLYCNLRINMKVDNNVVSNTFTLIMYDHTGCSARSHRVWSCETQHVFGNYNTISRHFTPIMYDHTGCGARSHRVWWCESYHVLLEIQCYLEELSSDYVRSHPVWSCDATAVFGQITILFRQTIVWLWIPHHVSNNFTLNMYDHTGCAHMTCYNKPRNLKGM